MAFPAAQPITCPNTLHQSADAAIQLNGARGYSKDTILRQWHVCS